MGIILWVLVILVIAALIKYLLTDNRKKERRFPASAASSAPYNACLVLRPRVRPSALTPVNANRRLARNLPFTHAIRRQACTDFTCS